MWRPTKIDTRKVPEVSEDVWKSIIKQFGENSNEAKIEVYGEFPESTEDQFISVETIRGAMEREVVDDPHAPLLMGVDVARSEVGDRTVIAFRKGRDARSIPWQIYKGLKGDQIVSKIAAAIDKYNPDDVFVDGGGVGGPIIDMLRSLGYRIREVQAGSKAEDSTTFPNKRLEMWWRMKEWLEIGCIPDNPDLMDDLKGPRLDNHRITGQMILESKKEMKKRGLASPDCFIAGTLIATPDGEKPIESIKPGDYVLTPFGKSRVETVLESNTDKLTTATFSNGSVLSGKGSHKIFTFDQGWVKMEALSLTNECDSYNPWSIAKWRILERFFTRMNRFFFKRQVDIISQEGKLFRRGFYIDASGLNTMEIFQTVFASTIKMVIGLITQSTILNVCRLQNMQASTQSKEWLSMNFAIWPFQHYKSIDILPQSGIDQLKDQNLQAVFPKRVGFVLRNENKQKLFASNAAKCSKHLWGQEQSIVQETVTQNLRTIKTKQLLEFVKFAARLLFSINTANRNVAPIRVQTKTVQETKTYNLTLESENVYYANGILVANCAEALVQTYAFKVASKNIKTYRTQTLKYPSLGIA
jgi:hypothetical protein